MSAFNYAYAYEAFLVAFLTTLLFIPPTIRIAEKTGVVDKPSPRRVNIRPVARLGGPTMFIGFLLSALPYILGIRRGPAILLGGFLILAVGTLDDIFGVKALMKLAAQILVALLMYFLGVRAAYVTNPFQPGHLYYLPAWLSLVVTVLWIVGIVNTMNIIDGLDGLAAGISCIASITLFLVALDKGQPESAYLAASMVGVSAGFLRWNFYPAKIFMGDSGAYFLGFMLAVTAIQGAFKSTVGLTYLIPVFVLGVPIFDTSFSVARRLQSRKPVMSQPDKGHIHHRMLNSGVGHREAVLIFYAMTLFLGVFSLLLVRAWLPALYLVCAIAALVPVLILAGKIFKRRRREKT